MESHITVDSAGVPERGRGNIRFAAPIVFATCLVVYSILFLLVPKGPGTSRTIGDEPHYLLMVQSLLEDGDLSLQNNYESEDYRRAGYFREKIEFPHLVIGGDGRPVSSHQVMTALIVLPGYALLGWRGAGLTMVLIVCTAAMLMFEILERFTRRGTAFAVTLFFFLTYPLLMYSHLVYPEVPALLLVALGFWSALRFRQRKKALDLAAAGIAASLLPHLHAKFLVLSMALGLLAVLCSRERPAALAWFFAPLAASLVVLVVWTRHVYGPDIIHGLTVSSGGEAFGRGSPWGVPGLYIDRAWGLLPFAPLYLALFAGMPLPRRGTFSEWWVFMPATVVAYTLVVGSFREWHGGVAPVPRYLVPLIPVFIVCSAVVVDGRRRRWSTAALAVLAAFQVVLTVFARIYPAAVYGLPAQRNSLYDRILGVGRLSNTVSRLFPLYHPTPSAGSVALTILWVLFLAGLMYARRYYLGAPPGEALGRAVALPPAA